MTDHAKTSTADTTFPLDGQLPSEVVVRSAGRLGSYRSYPVFSSKWFWKRTMLFAPVAATIGLMQSMMTWKLVDLRTGAIFTVCVILIWIVLVTAGPALATVVRHRRMPAARERICIILAVLIGIGISSAGQYAANRLTRDLLVPRAVALKTIPKPPQQRQPPNPLGTAMMYLWLGSVFFVLGGGVGIRTYFNEEKRWREAQREQQRLRDAARREHELEVLRLQKTEADMKLTVLQAQVEPHFLFNTLASVHSLVRQDPVRAEATIEALVDHLRSTLPKLRAGVGVSRSTLAEQLEVCASYLAVMQVRMGERLRYELDVPRALRAHPFPPLMVLSLVENAIKHGVEPCASGGAITIRATEINEGGEKLLEVSVIDDGVGLRPGLGDGMGLANIRAQLAAQFGARGRFSIQGRAEGGVMATLVVPVEEVVA